MYYYRSGAVISNKLLREPVAPDPRMMQRTAGKSGFAARVGISQTYLSHAEQGKGEVGAEILLRIAREFDKTIEWLLTAEDRPKP